MKNLGFISTLENHLRKWLGWCPETPKLVDYQKTKGSSFTLGKPRLIATSVALTASYCLVETAIGFFLLNYIYSTIYNREQQYFYDFIIIIVLFLFLVLLFTVSYFVGKKFDLKNNLVPIVISLYLGSLIFYVPFEIYYGVFAASPLISLRNILGMVSESMEVFLISFAGMAAAYLKRRNIPFYDFRLRIRLHNLRINWKVFSCTVSSLTIAEGFISLTEFFLLKVAGTLLFFNQYSPLVSIARVLVYPIFFVIVLFLIGRNLGIEVFPVMAFSLFIGCFVGLIAGNLISYLTPFGSQNLFNQLKTGEIMEMSYACFSFIYNLIYHFILGLSALAIGSLTKKP
jgi:sterol desaturase/sphingolipid hydroxylase (fatty acid hydroxylase superfamily)